MSILEQTADHSQFVPTAGSRVRADIRNVAIIAHIDHGKTTLVDAFLHQSGTFRSNQVVAERVMDSNDLEREKGITILSKVTAIRYKGIKINIVDTPGHSDFGGEVERVLRSVDGVLLVVDACEGPMPQTRFVLKKALQLKLKPIVVINKIDRPNARPRAVVNEVMDLFLELGGDGNQLDFPYLFTSATAGYAVLDPDHDRKDIDPLFQMIVSCVPPPKAEIDAPLQIQITSLDYHDHLGRLFGGKILRGTVRRDETVAIAKCDGSEDRFAVTRVFIYDGLKRVSVEEASAGEIVLLSGYDEVHIGETITDEEQTDAVDLIHIDEPTVSMDFIVNNGPWAGRSGKFVTMRNISSRLYGEVKTNISLKIEPTGSPDSLNVSGRGELQLAILLENMRRQGYEVMVSKPQVVIKEIDGVTCEPIEEVTIDVPDDLVGAMIRELSARKGQLISIEKDDVGGNRLIFDVSTRGMIGFRTEFMTLTSGLGMMSRIFVEYGPYRGQVVTRTRGSLVAKETGRATTYAIAPLQERSTIFVSPGEEVYEGQIVGENSRNDDMVVNITKAKKLSSMRSATKEATVLITAPRQFTLEQALSFLGDDELLEVTPDALRLRKRLLSSNDRKFEDRQSR
jgi:GTP-binding protein